MINHLTLLKFKVFDICENKEGKRVKVTSIKKKFYYFEDVKTKETSRMQYKIFEQRFDLVKDSNF